MDITHTLSLQEFMNYKQFNKEILPELIDFINNFPKTNKSIIKIQKEINKNESQDDIILYSQYTTILNKLSDSNLSMLSNDLIKLKIEKVDHIIKLAECVFNKAIIESKFVGMYAKLVKELSGYFVTINNVRYYFVRLLIEQCQIVFNRCIKNGENIEKNMEDNFMNIKNIGCMIFIGELYLYGLIVDKIIYSCIVQLLNLEKPLIGLVSGLFKIAGYKFMIKCPRECELIFDKFKECIDSGKLCNKDKFALMDLIDLKKKWSEIN
jgi:hypothetical protein